ncbi:hypothetical protein BS78_09G008900 [Paspalum vaginatum]|nr:hypothetical protein BS78_09G008900 [Paspalum vaginatum]
MAGDGTSVAAVCMRPGQSSSSWSNRVPLYSPCRAPPPPLPHQRPRRASPPAVPTCATTNCGSSAPELDEAVASGGGGLGDEARGLALALGAGNGGTPLLLRTHDEEPGALGLLLRDLLLLDGIRELRPRARLPVAAAANNSGSSAGCQPTGCAADLNAPSPAELRVMGASGGAAVVCRSGCDAFAEAEYRCSLQRPQEREGKERREVGLHVGPWAKMSFFSCLGWKR